MSSRFRTEFTTALALGFLVTATTVSLPDTASAQNSIRLGVDGLGEITAATPFDSVYLNSAFPHMRWEREDRPTEYGCEQVLHAIERSRRSFSLVSDGRGRIASITVESPDVQTWLGPRVGDPYDPLHRNHQLGDCSAGQEALSGNVICRAVQSDQVTYVFSGVWNGPDGQLPPSHALDAWVITSISWLPDRFSGVPESFIVHVPVTPVGPSYDCAQASESIEQMICSDHELSELDQKLSAVFVSALETSPPRYQKRLKAKQRGWIKARNECWKAIMPRACVIENYMARIAALEAGAMDLS